MPKANKWPETNKRLARAVVPRLYLMLRSDLFGQLLGDLLLQQARAL